MPVNNKPIFSGLPAIRWYGGTVGLNANTSSSVLSGTLGTDIYRIFEADKTYGSYVQKIRFKPIGGTSQATNNIASLARIWISDGYGVVNTGDGYSHHCLYDEVAMPATTATAVASLTTVEVPLNISLPPLPPLSTNTLGYTIYVTIQSAVAAGYHVCVVGGDYIPA